MGVFKPTRVMRAQKWQCGSRDAVPPAKTKTLQRHSCQVTQQGVRRSSQKGQKNSRLHDVLDPQSPVWRHESNRHCLLLLLLLLMGQVEQDQEVTLEQWSEDWLEEGH